MPLPGGMWLLDYLQDRFYDIRGPEFVIRRAETEVHGSANKVARKKGTLVVPGSAGDAAGGQQKETALDLIHKVVRNHPGSVTLQLEGATIDISDYLEPWADEDEEEESAAQGEGRAIVANNTCTGIVRVEQEASADEEEEAPEGEELDVFWVNSASPRRTKKVGFTCKCCGARTYSSVNPRAFLEGTLVAQCANPECERWHKLADHFGLFHDLQGPLFRARSVREEDIPPSLRLPSFWQDFDGADDADGAR